MECKGDQGGIRGVPGNLCKIVSGSFWGISGVLHGVSQEPQQDSEVSQGFTAAYRLEIRFTDKRAQGYIRGS